MELDVYNIHCIFHYLEICCGWFSADQLKSFFLTISNENFLAQNIYVFLASNMSISYQPILEFTLLLFPVCRTHFYRSYLLSRSAYVKANPPKLDRFSWNLVAKAFSQAVQIIQGMLTTSWIVMLENHQFADRNTGMIQWTLYCSFISRY